MREQNLEKLGIVPAVHDATQLEPEPETTTMPRPGRLVAVVGTPIHNGVPTYDIALGFCVWALGGGAIASPMLIYDEAGPGVGILLDADGTPMYGFPE